MLDKTCKDPSLDRSFIPSLQGNTLTARCECGHTLSVDVTEAAHSEHCDGCGQPAVEGLAYGPDWSTACRIFPKAIVDADNVVYFVRSGPLVKIGTTGKLEQRLKQLRNPELLGVIPGGYALERENHLRWAHLLVSGREVFTADPELLDWISDNTTLPEPEPSTPSPEPQPHSWAPAWVRIKN